MTGISAIIITYREAENIRECLSSLNWVDEIIVVDAESTDGTIDIAREYTANVFVRPWEGFTSAKNFALSKCNNDWVLWIDADERVSPNLAREIRQATKSDEISGYELPRRAFFLGKWIRYSDWYPGYVLRLFKRREGIFNDGMRHIDVSLQGKVGRLENDLLHYTNRNINHYFRKFNYYTSLTAEQLYQSGKRFRTIDLLFRPPATFFRIYFLKLGFLDGLQGLIYAVFSAAHSFAKFAKLWEIQYQLPEQSGREQRKISVKEYANDLTR